MELAFGAVDANGTGGRAVNAGYHLYEGRFAGAVVADKRQDFIGIDIEIDRIVGEMAAVFLGQTAYPDKRFGRSGGGNIRMCGIDGIGGVHESLTGNDLCEEPDPR